MERERIQVSRKKSRINKSGTEQNSLSVAYIEQGRV